MPENQIDYNFIEIGTSNFHALIIDCPNDYVGLSIEPLQGYLDSLPNKPNVTKVPAAISDQDGEIEIYNIPLSQIRKHNLPIWVKGTNSVSKPHEYARKKIGEELYDSIVSIDKVKMMSWKTLISNYKINTIDYLKIDTEGHDHVILKSYFEECEKSPKLYANKILFEYNESSNKEALDLLISKLTNYKVEYLEHDVLLTKTESSLKKAYVLYATENYFDIVSMACKSIRTFSNLPIFVYLLDCDLKVNIKNVTTINWKSNFSGIDDTKKSGTSNYYIDRSSQKIYELLIQRPLIVKDALENYSDVVAYVDSDSIATQYCDRIFEMYNPKLDYPYFVEGIYEYLHINGRGGAETREDMSTTLEHPACELFGANQYIRQKYRQTGYFVAGPNTIDFLEEWYWMCSHPKVLKDFKHYAPYHEETIANVLLWKYGHLDGLPYIYMNGDNQSIDKIFKEKLFTGKPRNLGPWFKIPGKEEDLLFVHGEKRGFIQEEMIERLKIRASGLRNNYNIDPTKNWGDVLSQFLLEHFSGKKLKKEDVFYFDDAAHMLDKNGKIVGIGSSMKYVRPDDYVWGTGCIDEHHVGNKPKKVYSVRGPLTRDILLKRGWDVPEIYGDPALLFPQIYNPTIEKKHKIGLIPHCVDFYSLDGLKAINHMEDMGVKIINVTSGIYEFIDQIKECEMIISSSLHGLIAADAYGIPNHRVKISKLVHGGDFKYKDHYASVKREHYEPLQLTDTTTLDEVESLNFEIGDISLTDKLLKHNPWNDPNCIYIQNAPLDKSKIFMNNKVRIVHLLLEDDLSPERSQKSINSIKPLESFGIEYIPVWNKIWKETPPRDTFLRGDSYDTIPVKPQHYGNYHSHREALLNYFDETIDYLIICEGDAELTLSPIETAKKIKEAIVASEKYNIGYFNFGSRFGLTTGRLISPTIEQHDDIHISDSIINIQMSMIPKSSREFLKSKYNTGLWDGADLILNHFFKDSDLKIALFENPLCLQIEGMSNIDSVQTKYKIKNKLKILFLAPHLSTGGMPGFLLKRIELLQSYCPELEIFVVEYGFYGDAYVVQRNKIKEILPENHFWSLGDNKMNLINIIKENNIDIVHVDEVLEGFDSFNKVSKELMSELYDNNRTWRIVETCHNVWFDPTSFKLYHPDAYAFCTPYHKEKTFANVPSYGEVLEFPIDKMFRTNEEQLVSQKKLDLDINKIHVINVGLWTSGKNQKEGVEIARLLEKSNPEIQFHFIGNQAPNFKSYWEPIMENLPSNVKVWGERNDVSTFMKASDVFMFNSTWECNPLVLREAASYGLKILSRNLPQYMDMFTKYITPIDDDINKTKDSLLSLINDERRYDLETGQGKRFALDHLKFYELVNSKEPKKQTKVNSNVKITQYFVNQPFLEITGNSDKMFEVKFFDEKGTCHYTNKTEINRWFKLNREYFTKWNTKVWEDGELIYDDILSFKDKKVFISFDSSSLGDTIAWIPYVLEFQKQHECKVVVSTHKNFLFENVYPELEFVKPGSTVSGIHGMYTIGWFYNSNKEPEMPNTIPLQKTATNILGLKYEEIRPRIDYKIGERPYEGKYITIATNSTSGCKFWTKEGWQELINYLHSLGYKIINVSKEKNPFKNAEQIKDTSMENTLNVIHHSEFFIGLSSGLSWLSWGIGKHVVMISNFTEPDHEFTSNCTRIINLDVCNGCWNRPEFKFDKGDWDWCPVHKGTNRHFECHKSITSKMVIEQLKHLL